MRASAGVQGWGSSAGRSFGTHEGTIASPEQEFRIDERRQQPVTVSALEAPQPLRLRRGQAQPGHLQVLALNSPQHVVKPLHCCHVGTPFD